MLAVDFPESNETLIKPPKLKDEQCASLRVWKGTGPIDEAGTIAPLIVSVWKLTREDIEEIQRTGTVYMICAAISQPPVSLQTENPFE
jgi:hypothetical protein